MGPKWTTHSGVMCLTRRTNTQHSGGQKQNREQRRRDTEPWWVSHAAASFTHSGKQTLYPQVPSIHLSAISALLLSRVCPACESSKQWNVWGYFKAFPPWSRSNRDYFTLFKLDKPLKCIHLHFWWGKVRAGHLVARLYHLVELWVHWYVWVWAFSCRKGEKRDRFHI